MLGGGAWSGAGSYLRDGALSRPPPEGSPVLLGQPADAVMRLRGGLLPRPPPEGLPVLLGPLAGVLLICFFSIVPDSG